MYPSDLSDEAWRVIEVAMPRGKKSGRPRQRSVRQMMNAIFYVEKTGCQWRQLPLDFPPWKQVYNTYWRWRKRGVWLAVLTTLREQHRVRQGRTPRPSVAIIDSQSVKTTAHGNSVATMQGKRSKAANGTSPSIHKETYSR
jgi:transposase